jgi:serine/threonine-protein kinase
VACLAFVVTVGVAVFFLKRKEPEPVGSTAESAAVAPSAVAPVPSPSPDTAAEPNGTAAPNGTMIELRIQSSPRTADLFLDGARLPSNPFTGKFPADGIGHRVHAEAEDHRTAAKIVVFDRDASIEIALEPKRGVASIAGGGSPAREQAKAEEPAAPPVSAAPAPEEPSLAAAKTGKPKRQLDSSEPWSTPAATSGSAKPKRKLDSSPW